MVARIATKMIHRRKAGAGTLCPVIFIVITCFLSLANLRNVSLHSPWRHCMTAQIIQNSSRSVNRNDGRLGKAFVSFQA